MKGKFHETINKNFKEPQKPSKEIQISSKNQQKLQRTTKAGKEPPNPSKENQISSSNQTKTSENPEISTKPSN